MKCPRILKHIEIEKGEIYDEPLDCLKEECACWDEDLECCGEVSKRASLKLIAQLLDELVDKMPHANQFTK